MGERQVWLTILGMSAATMIPRLIPMVALPRRPLPPFAEAWLRHIPVAILSAMLASDLIGGPGDSSAAAHAAEHGARLMAAGAAFLVAIWRRTLLPTVAVGMVILALARWWAGG